MDVFSLDPASLSSIFDTGAGKQSDGGANPPKVGHGFACGQISQMTSHQQYKVYEDCQEDEYYNSLRVNYTACFNRLFPNTRYTIQYSNIKYNTISGTARYAWTGSTNSSGVLVFATQITAGRASACLKSNARNSRRAASR